MQIISNAKFHTTHCITAKNSRTKQVIRALAFGAWMLPFDYIKMSKQKNRWLHPGPFELSEYGPRAKRYDHNPTLFESILFFVSPNCKPPQNFMQEIIEIIGGRITQYPSEAHFCIGQMDIPTIAEKWIIDSLSSGEQLDCANYKLSPS